MVHGAGDMQVAVTSVTSVSPRVAALAAGHTEEVHAAARLVRELQAVLGAFPGVNGRGGEDGAQGVQLVPAG